MILQPGWGKNQGNMYVLINRLFNIEDLSAYIFRSYP